MKRLFFVTNFSVGLIPASILLVLVLIGKNALASKPEYEILCRAKAKETATEFYRTCVTENRNAQIDALKKDYQDKLRSMKDDYEKELSRIAGKSVAQNPTQGSKDQVTPKDQGPSKDLTKKVAKGAKSNSGKRKGVAQKKTIYLPNAHMLPQNENGTGGISSDSASLETSEVFDSRAVQVPETGDGSLDVPEPIPLPDDMGSRIN